MRRKSICSCILPVRPICEHFAAVGRIFWRNHITSEYLATITVWANEQATPSSSVCLEPANKKLRLLGNPEPDDGDGDGSTNSSKDDDTSTFRFTQKVAAYLGLRVLTKDVSYTLLETSRQHISESKPYCESLFNIERVFRTGREHVLCRWPCQEFATLGNFAAPSQSCLLCAWQLR